MRLKFAGLTDIGRTRDNNEDNFYISESEPLCVVADGMGGHSSGEVASALAIRTMREYYQRTGGDPNVGAEQRAKLPTWPFKRRAPEHIEQRRLVQAVMMANDVVYSYAQKRQQMKGMGTTIVSAYFIENGMYLVHIGDSRAYRVRGDSIERITRDHSLADEYLEMGILRAEELEAFPYKNVVTRAVGLAEVVEPEDSFCTVQPGDIFVLCSDGLTDPLSDEQIRSIVVASASNIEQACRNLIDAANAAGGPDNVTVVLAQAVN
jgi:serine/threonine protein phosphatase PrpC